MHLDSYSGMPASSSPFGDPFPVGARFAKHPGPPNASSLDETLSGHRWQTAQLGEIPVDLWTADTGYHLPESWAQTIDSILSISGPDLAGDDSSTTRSASVDPTALFVSTASNSSASSPCLDNCAAAQPQPRWPVSTVLHSSPSNSFDTSLSHSQPRRVSTPVSVTSLADKRTSELVSSLQPGEGPAMLPFIHGSSATDHPGADRSSQIPSPFRSLFESIPKPQVSGSPLPQPQFVAPADLALPPSLAPIPALRPRIYPAPVPPSPPNVPAPTKKPVPVARLVTVVPPPVRDPQPTAPAPRGLSGWQPGNESKLSLPAAAFLRIKPPCPRPSVVRAAPYPEAVSPPIVPLAARRKTRCARYSSTVPSGSSTYGDALGSDDDGDEEGDDDDDDDDVYQPSSSPARSRSPSPGCDLAYPPTYGEDAHGIAAEPYPSTTKRTKGKAKGSAALALAVVTQLSQIQQEAAVNGVSTVDDAALARFFDEGHDDIDLEEKLRAVRHIRKRKNSAIPHPVPVPHLIKKSRGRKVPYISPQLEATGSTTIATEVALMISSSSEASTSIQGHSTDESLSHSPNGQPARSARGTRGRKTSTPYSLAEGGKRSYMCEVPGCGKCFVRGEHLKRHVRSIHTYDKPHPCPYNGCDKTFSRRDNLGQHVRIHLQA